MNKKELVNTIAEKSEMSKKDSTKVLESVLETIQHGLAEGNDVKIHGFGNFTVKDIAARKGRNPQDGSEIDIPASRRVGFKPAKALKDSVKGS